MIRLLRRRRRGFPHPHSLPGDQAVSWERSVFCAGRDDLPFPVRLRVVDGKAAGR